MTGSKHSPFSNQDAVVATGLAFAGMAVLQSKLFPAFSLVDVPGLDLLSGRVLEWWPLLLIGAGVWLWVRSNSEKRANSSISQLGGSK